MSPAARLAEPVVIALRGRITVESAAAQWRDALAALQRNPARPVTVDASELEYIDAAGIALLFDLRRQQRAPGTAVELRGLAPDLAALVDAYDPKDFAQSVPPHAPLAIVEQFGRAAAAEVAYVETMIGFLGQCAAAAAHALTHRRGVRWGEVVAVAAEAGANAVPIVLLIGFLMGVIIAFEVGLVAQQFGAVIFVVNGVGVAMLRELGPLMTAIVFAGRTGAAFAAQLGTQKVNEEINAITTFGLDPVRFLVLPRLLAAALVVPLLVAMADVVGLIGGALVMLDFDVGLVQFYTQLLGAVGIADFLVGMAKALVFGVTIAAIGCQRGLATGAGATSVGLSATSAVVTSIVWIVVLDGLFTVLLSRLGI